MKSFILAAIFLTSSLVSAAPPTAVTKQPFTTLTSPPISTSSSANTITFIEGTNENPPDTRFKFPTVPVNGYATLKLRSDGTYDNDGLLRNDSPTSGKSYNVAFWWKITDAAGRKYYFGSDKTGGGTGCGPAKVLKDRGDICDWYQDNKSMAKIKNHWADLQAGAKATAFPVVF